MNKKYLKQELKKLFKSMDYIANKYLSKTKIKISRKKAELFFNVYQQLGLAWAFLSLQCKHWDGYKKRRGKYVCRICGSIKGVNEEGYLLPVKGKKVIGRMIRPERDNIGKSKLSKKKAEIINDTIKFHGAKLNVSVFNEYKSKLNDSEINIAADRVVKLYENGVIIDVCKDIMGIRVKKLSKGIRVYGGFVDELPKKILKKMPIILSYDKSGNLVQIELIR